jgi:hypothetical protein
MLGYTNDILEHSEFLANRDQGTSLQQCTTRLQKREKSKNKGSSLLYSKKKLFCSTLTVRTVTLIHQSVSLCLIHAGKFMDQLRIPKYVLIQAS